MNRLKLLAAAMLLAVPIACGDPIDPPPPTGSIDGLVSIEGQGVDAVSVTLSNGASAITANGGMYRFDGVEAGAYTVTISNYPDDASFNQTSAAATIATDGQNVTVNFPGSWIRTSSIMGTVTVENEGLGGVTVKLSGVSDSETLTDGGGQYAFTGLRAGNYTVEITGFDDEDVAFGSTSSAATVATGESKVVSFEGTYLRTSGIVGQVTADEEPQEGIAVSLQGRGESRTVSTNSAGQFSFEQLRRGDYSVVISGYDTDEMSFDVTSQSVTVAYGETANVPFEGILLRTAGITGTVTVEGVGPISDVTVTIQGEGAPVDGLTDNMGVYSFENLRAGEYSVAISGFDDDEYGFPDGTSATVTVELQETGTVPFDGIMLRTAAIEGTVTVGDDDAPLPGVMVTVSGGPRDEEHSTTTNDDGMYMVENLHAGTYSVTISGYDTREYGFDPTTRTLTVDLRDTGEAAFQGELLRTAGVSGRVHVGGTGLPGVTVTLTGEESRQGNTNADGQYGFSGLAAGDYTVTISGWDEVEYAFEPTMEVTLELDETETGVNFAGRALRTATVMGYVTVEGDALPGIQVALLRFTGETAVEVLGQSITDADGAYSFGPLLAGAYLVNIVDGYEDEHVFEEMQQFVAVETDGTAEVNFAATINRTAGVSGMVTVDGDAMADVEVTLAGDHAGDDNTMTTGADGMYSFGGLRKGDYTVSIENPDADAYSFPSTSQSLNLSVGQEQTGISFAGARLMQASISGQVHAEGDPVAGVMVTLSGDADAEDVTDDNGEYNFPSLAGGDYMVTIAGWNEAAYDFASAEAAVDGLGTDEFKIVDFAGTHTRTASIGGMLFIDEGGPNALMHDEGEPVLDLDAVLPEDMPGLPITLLGPELTSTPQFRFASRDGMYSFGDLRAGTYVINVDVETVINEAGHTVEGLLAHLGYEYTGPSLARVSVAAAEESDDNNLPFKITLQTINVGAVMGTPEAATATRVGGVKLALYPTAEAAAAGAPVLGTATTGADPEMPNHGVATFHFPRALDLGPGGAGNDRLVIAKVTSTGDADLAFSDNKDIEIQYAATDRVSNALAAARLVNVQVNFQWWVKSNADAKDGDEFLEGWVANNAMATDASGLAAYSGPITVAEAIAGASYDVMLAEEQHTSVTGKERWMQSTALTHEHNHLALPADNTSEVNDLGPIYVTWTTQSLTLGVYREADDVEGYTDYRSALPSGDVRPHSRGGRGHGGRAPDPGRNNRLRLYDEWDHDCDDDGVKEEPTEPRDAEGNFAAGMITFNCLPAGEEFTVRYRAGDDREQMDYGYDEIETFGYDLLDFGMTVGAFGAMSGGGPEVRMCSASDPDHPDATSDDWCATFAYQWETGMVYGTVGEERNHKVTVEPETGHGAIGDEDKTNADGEYSIGGLQDGVYTATAASGDNDYQLLTPAEVDGIALYHNEACWASPRPTNDACSSAELVVDEIDEDDDTTWAYVNAHPESWETGRLGLAISGYVANDGQDGEGLDNLLRGDESMAGITMTLWNSIGTRTLATTDTDASGFYSFDELAMGSYIVSAGRVSNARAIHNISRHPRTRAWRVVNYKSATAQDYPDFPDEADLAKPYWNRAFHSSGRTMGNATSTVYGLDDDSSDDDATLYNFALVYTDGQLTGSVNNISGSSGDIDLVFSSPVPYEDDRERTTDRRGNFEIGGLMEAIGYTAVIEDRGFAAPCMNAAGTMADDDATEDDGSCSNPADTELRENVLGKDDHENMGTLYVYNSGMSEADAMTAIEVMGQTAVLGDDVDLGGTVEQSTTGTTTITTVSTTPITFSSESVEVDATISGGASMVVMMGDRVCAGDVCELNYNATGSGRTGNASTEITVMVTAENGYNDHAYTFSVSRTNPVDNVLERGEILDQAGNEAGGTGGDGETPGTPWQVTTGAAAANSITLTFDLEEVVGRGDDAICGQSISVKIYGGATRDPIGTDTDNDACDGEQYRLSAGTSGTLYEITITSQDDVAKKYYMNLRRGAANRAPQVASPIDDAVVGVDASIAVNVASNFSDADNDALTYTAESDATSMATVAVSGSVVTIRGMAAGTANITVTATDPDGASASDDFEVAVSAANHDPTVDNPILDQMVEVGATTAEIDLSTVFGDPDDDALTYTAESGDTTMATVAVSGSMLEITGVAVGTAGITVTATDPDGASASDAFEVTVSAANRAPQATEIADQLVGLNGRIAVNVASNFSDADDDALTYTAVSDATDTATVEVIGSVVTIRGMAEGTAGITVTATDPDGASASTDFEVTVSAANHDPTVDNPILDQMVEVGDTTAAIDLSTVFDDPDDDALTYTAESGDTTMATVAVSGSMLTITGVAAGTANITVTATDPDDASASDEFDVTVGAANHDPTVDNPILDQMVEVGDTTAAIDLSTVFDDPDDDALTYTAESGDTTMATVAVSGSMLTIAGVAEGTANITVTADDGNGGTVDDVFDVTVSAAANRAPTVTSAIGPQDVEVGEAKEIDADVADNFADLDGDTLTFIVASDDETKATAELTGSVLTITGVAEGSATITVTADDGNGGTVDDAFGVTVAPTSPAIVLSVTEATVRENSEATYTVRLATQPATDVTVTIVVAAVDGSDDVVNHVTTTRDNTPLIFTNSNWGTARTVLIQVGNDPNEHTEVAELTHTATGPTNYTNVTAVLTVTAEDDDIVAGAAIDAATSVDVDEGDTDGAKLMVKLSAEPTGEVTVSAAFDPASDVATITGSPLTFTTDNWDTEQGITITGEEDADPVDAMATLMLAASGGGYGLAEDVEVTVNVADDEEATISIADGVSGAEVIEGGDMTYNVTLSAPPPVDQTVLVNLSVTGPASVSPAQAVFTSGGTTDVPIAVTPFSDSDSDDESVTISHSVDASDGSGYESATAPSNVSVTIKDDEAAGVVVSRTALSVEEGGTATYTVRLTTAPSDGETVTINLAGAGVNLSATSLEFTASNFLAPQTVTVTGHVDVNDVDDMGSVVHTVVSSGGDYAAVTASTVNITVKEPSG